MTDDDPPMPSSTTMHATVRNFGYREIPVARVTFGDVAGELRELDFDAERALDLAFDLLAFVRQVRSSTSGFPVATTWPPGKCLSEIEGGGQVDD